MSKHPTRNLELGFEDLAKYPFLDETLEYIRSVGFEIDELLKPEYADVVERAKNRILPSIKKGELDDSFSDARIEILSFPIALMLVRATDMNHVMSKYALAESIRIEKFLSQELIRKKRDGLILSHSEIGFLVQGISDESLTDAQLGAFDMAIFH